MDETPFPPKDTDVFDLPDPRATNAAEGLPHRRFAVTEVEAMVRGGIMMKDERVERIGGELVPENGSAEVLDLTTKSSRRRSSRLANSPSA